MESQVSGLAKSVKKSHVMRVTCITRRIILHTTRNILHIEHIILHKTHNILLVAHNIFHIIRSYAMGPWNHGLDVRTSQNEGSTYGTSTRDPSLANTKSTSFIHTYLISFIRKIV